MIAIEVDVNGKRQCLAGAVELTTLSVALFLNGPLASDGKDVQSNLHIGGVATDGSETIRRHMTWGARMPQIAVGDTISVHVVNVPPQTAEAPDSNNDLERNAFEAAKAKYLELKPKYEP
jgi:beta-xylosidase